VRLCTVTGRNNADRDGAQVSRVVPDADLQGLSRQKPQDQDRNTHRQASKHEACRVGIGCDRLRFNETL